LKLIIGEGDSIEGDTFRIGNTNSRLRFGLPPAEFFERWCAEGPTHHVALGVGHRADEVERVARLVGLEHVRIGR
jgi:L-arabinose isomerase